MGFRISLGSSAWRHSKNGPAVRWEGRDKDVTHRRVEHYGGVLEGSTGEGAVLGFEPPAPTKNVSFY